MRATLIFCALVALVVSPLAAAPLDSLLANPALWTLTQDDFEKLPEARMFRWTSAAKDSARAADRKLTLFDLPLVEVVVRFDKGKLSQVTPVIYARGDAGGMSQPTFTALVGTARDTLTNYSKVPVVVRGKDATNAVHAEGLIWNSPAAHYLLEYSFTKENKVQNTPFRAEFIRLEIKPPEGKVSLLATINAAQKGKFSAPAHIKKDAASGDVVIPDVPMVDQGQKGYCAVACAERMMRYYGIPTDANEIAQVSNSDASRGTSAEAMFEALKKLGARLHVRVRAVEQFEVRQMLNLITEYNHAAKRDKVPPLPDPGHMIDVSAIYREMNPDVLKEVRLKNKSELTRFQSDVQKHIDAGIPLIWSVMLGIVKEQPDIPQAYGGHMRLIIGYNTKTQQIMYTDSWGAGHELKRMGAADAWTITTGLTAIEPM